MLLNYLLIYLLGMEEPFSGEQSPFCPERWPAYSWCLTLLALLSSYVERTGFCTKRIAFWFLSQDCNLRFHLLCFWCHLPTFETKPSANAIDPLNQPLESNGFYLTKSINNCLRSNTGGYSCIIY
jgi:hypothetical protein